MGVPERVDEVSDLEPSHLRDHVGEERVRGDVERYAEKQVARALVELAREPPLGDVELEQGVARGKRHLRQVRDVPGVDHMASRVRVLADLLDHRPSWSIRLPSGAGHERHW